MPTKNRCILIVGGKTHTERLIQIGIERYCRKNQLDWQLQVPSAPRRSHLPQTNAREWDGVIGRLAEPSLSQWIDQAGLPCVAWDGASVGRYPTVIPDDHSIARCAVDHLLSQGLKNLAVLSRHRSDLISERQSHFVQLCQERGIACVVADSTTMPQSPNDEDRLVQWLLEQQRPLGIFFHQDNAAAFHIEFCQRNDLGIPADIAVLGVDDDVDLCRMLNPPLSSVIVPWSQIGTRLAANLHRQLTANAQSLEPERVPSYAVRARASTSRLPSDEPLINRAMQWINANYHKTDTVLSLAEHCGVHKATLYRRFRQVLRTTPKQIIDERRIQLFLELIDDKQLNLTTIARRCGFRSLNGLNALLHAQLGTHAGALGR